MRFIAIICAGILSAHAAPAYAQLIEPNRDFDANRLRPAIGKEGILTVDSGAVPGHLNWDIALWLNWADDPVVLVERAQDGGERRITSLLKGRLDAHLVGAISLYDWVQVALEVPISLYQWRNAKGTQRFGLQQLASTGLGDLGIRPKLRILTREDYFVDVALVAGVTFPTAVDKNNYLGEESLTFEPEIAASVPLWDDQISIAANISARVRESVLSDAQATRVEHELILRLGAAVHLHEILGVPITGKISFEGFTQAGNPFASLTEGGAEMLVGVDYEITDLITAYAGGGWPMATAYSIPDFRAFIGVRLARRQQDRDGDRINDADDACPDEPEDMDSFEDADGCPDPDNDGDGVLDVDDKAPLDPEDFDGFEDEDGAPDPDNDGDGIPDTEDGAPLLPEDFDGFEDEDGIPDPDNDLDGILDANEECPDEAEDFDGFEDDDGCPDLDNDKDGIPDVVDDAPLLPEDFDGFEDDDGAPEPDNDMDGFLDEVDECPLLAEVINGIEDDDGCPDVGKSLTRVTGAKIEILEKVFFDTAKATIQERSIDLLKQVAAVLKANPQLTKMRVEGHTDSVGSNSYNKDLSQARATSVRTFLIDNDVAAERLEAVGFGEDRPITSNASARGRETNRRVEFVIVEVGGERIDADGEVEQEKTP